jgi:hypothetical protein
VGSTRSTAFVHQATKHPSRGGGGNAEQIYNLVGQVQVHWTLDAASFRGLDAPQRLGLAHGVIRELALPLGCV